MASGTRRYSLRQWVGLVGGPALFLVLHWGLPTAGGSPAGNVVLATTVWMAAWWMSEAVPIPVTSLLPIVAFPAFGVASVSETTAPYADPIVFLFLGGFAVALAIERWGLHRRIALAVLTRAGEDPRRLVLGFLVATAALSMWISNTATAMMMLPIGMAVIAHLEGVHETDGAGATGEGLATAATTLGTEHAEPSRIGTTLVLAIAYGASIGGIATLIGSPPNAILAGILRSTLGVQLGFLQWMAVGLPITVVFLAVTWVVLLAIYPPEPDAVAGGRVVLEREREALGPIGRGERRTMAVFALVVLGWVTRPFLIEPIAPAITDTVVAVVGGILVFLVPVDLRRGEFLLDWEATTRIPWGILLLFGAGFTLARGFQSSGLDRWIAGALVSLRGIDPVVVVLVVVALVVFLTEVTSNSATASVFVPVMASLALTLGLESITLMTAVALAASFAFMLPVATPPNAIVFGSGAVTIPRMARVGFVLNLLGIVLLTVVVTWWLPVVWG